MNLEYFIAKRVAIGGRNSFSGKIILIAIIAIMLSMAVMIAATSLISGFKYEISEKIFGFWGHIHITDYNTENSVESIPININQSFYNGQHDAEILANIGNIHHIKRAEETSFPLRLLGDREVESNGGVRHVQMYANKAGIIKAKDQLEGIVLKGIGKDFDWTFIEQYMTDGYTLSFPDSVASNGILISESTAKRLKLKVSDKFTVHFVESGTRVQRLFSVTGIYKTGLEEYDKKFALVDIRRIQQLNGWSENEVSGFEVFIDDIRDLDAYDEYIYYQVLGPNLMSRSIKDVYPGIFNWLNLQDVNERLILALMIIVSIVNMMTALMILILERTNMIGILKSLGSSNLSVRKIFLYHAAYIIGFGLLLGNILGIGFCLLQKHFGFIQLPEESYYVSIAPIEMSIPTIIIINIATFLITLLVLLIPSMLVTRIDPVKAIRFK